MQAFIDETKEKGLLVVATFARPNDLTAARKALRKHLISGQRRIHFTKESDPRRRSICSMLCELSLEVVVYDASGIQNKATARQMSLSLIVGDLAAQRGNQLIIEQDDSLVASDRRILFEAVRKHEVAETLRYHHKRPHEEELLWVSDAVAWCWAKGGGWRDRVRPIVTDVRVVVP
ncbi:hypothetical protein ACTD5D_41255 [Nocardia takedensis]|uniref:hypothetical protein n=1 Tax=Nocardia takedensis TaxID=259390 RepID=UPI003F75C008